MTHAQHIKIHAQLSKPANKRGTCRRHTPSTCRHTRTALDTGNWTKIHHSHPLKHANKCSALEAHADNTRPAHASTHTHSSRHRKPNEDTTRSSLETSQQMLSSQTNAQPLIQVNACRYTLISWYEPTNVDTCSALDNIRHMQKHAKKLGIGAYTHAGLQYVQVHA